MYLSLQNAQTISDIHPVPYRMCKSAPLPGIKADSGVTMATHPVRTEVFHLHNCSHGVHRHNICFKLLHYI